MAVATPAQQSPAGKSLGIGTGITATWSSISLTTGRGLLVLLEWGDGTATITVGGMSASTDGALSAATAAFFTSGTDKGQRGQWFYLPTIATATQNFVVTYTNDANAGVMAATFFEITGHDTASMIGGSQNASVALSMSLTTESANSAVFVALQAGNSETANVTSSGMTFTKYDHTNAYNSAAVSYALDTGAAGSKTINWSDYGYFALGVEVKAAAGGGGGVSKSTKFLMTGIG